MSGYHWSATIVRGMGYGLNDVPVWRRSFTWIWQIQAAKPATRARSQASSRKTSLTNTASKSKRICWPAGSPCRFISQGHARTQTADPRRGAPGRNLRPAPRAPGLAPGPSRLACLPRRPVWHPSAPSAPRYHRLLIWPGGGGRRPGGRGPGLWPAWPGSVALLSPRFTSLAEVPQVL